MIRAIAITAALCVLAGCAHQMTAENAISSGVRHEFTQNYKLGQRKTVVVGDAVVKVRDYYVESIAVAAVVPTESVTLTGGPVAPMTFSTAQPYKIQGRIELDGESYLVVPNTENPVQWQGALVGAEGRIYKHRVAFTTGMHGPVTVIYEQTISPASARMHRRTEERVSTTKGYQNYELIYNGVAGGIIQLTYREFSPEGLARTAFYQNLTYDAKSEFIRFKAFRIQVHSANTETIEYTVVEDGGLRPKNASGAALNAMGHAAAGSANAAASSSSSSTDLPTAAPAVAAPSADNAIGPMPTSPPTAAPKAFAGKWGKNSAPPV